MMAFVGQFAPLRVSNGRARSCLCRSSRAVPSASAETGGVAVSRRALLTAFAAAAASGAFNLHAPAVAAENGSTSSGLQYTVVKRGSGPKVEVGDLVGIRFRGSYAGKVFDDLFTAPDAYFYRVGNDNILKGIDEAVQFMRVGDVYDLTLPPSLAFGKKGRRASAGKASIPPDAQVEFTLELTSCPGKEDELLEAVDL